MNRPTSVAPDKAAHARSLCEKGLWPDVLVFAEKWQAESPDEAKGFFYQGAAFAATSRFPEAETAYYRRAGA